MITCVFRNIGGGFHTKDYFFRLGQHVERERNFVLVVLELQPSYQACERGSSGRCLALDVCHVECGRGVDRQGFRVVDLCCVVLCRRAGFYAGLPAGVGTVVMQKGQEVFWRIVVSVTQQLDACQSVMLRQETQ